MVFGAAVRLSQWTVRLWSEREGFHGSPQTKTLLASLKASTSPSTLDFVLIYQNVFWAFNMLVTEFVNVCS